MSLLSPQIQPTKKPTFEDDWDDLVWKRQSGHMGHHEFDERSMNLWARFREQYKDVYYPPSNQTALVHKAAEISAKFIDGPITLVSRGPGTAFAENEAYLGSHLGKVMGVVYIDRAHSALDQAIKAGKKVFPNAWHKPICSDLFDPYLEYPVIGTEVNAMFGLTELNVPAFDNQPSLRKAFQERIRFMRQQMSLGAHYITVADSNQDKLSVEAAYAGQNDFALYMLQNHQIKASFDFEVEFHPHNHVLSHYFVAKRDIAIQTLSGVNFIKAGDRRCFNTSVKLPIEKHIGWTEQVGFKSLFHPEEVIKDHQNRLGWLHFQVQE